MSGQDVLLIGGGGAFFWGSLFSCQEGGLRTGGGSMSVARRGGVDTKAPIQATNLSLRPSPPSPGPSARRPGGVPDAPGGDPSGQVSVLSTLWSDRRPTGQPPEMGGGGFGGTFTIAPFGPGPRGCSRSKGRGWWGAPRWRRPTGRGQGPRKRSPTTVQENKVRVAASPRFRRMPPTHHPVDPPPPAPAPPPRESVPVPKHPVL